MGVELTQTVTTRPPRTALSTVLALDEEVVPRPPCPIIAPLAVFKYAAAFDKRKEKTVRMKERDCSMFKKL